MGIYDLRLREKDFWRLTLRKFDLLVKRLSIDIDRQEFRIAKVCASIYNANGVKKRGGKKGFLPDDFLPQTEQKKPNWEKQLQMVEMLNKVFGGIDKRKN